MKFKINFIFSKKFKKRHKTTFSSNPQISIMGLFITKKIIIYLITFKCITSVININIWKNHQHWYNWPWNRKCCYYLVYSKNDNLKFKQLSTQVPLCQVVDIKMFKTSNYISHAQKYGRPRSSNFVRNNNT